MSLSVSGGGWQLDKGVEPFPDPFLDYASTAMPRSIREALEWSEYIFTAHGFYSSAIERVLSYFLTPLEISGEDIGADEKEKYEKFFENTLQLRRQAWLVARDFLCYGNVFCSFITPFRRYLRCGNKSCAHERPFRIVKNNSQYRFTWTGKGFFASCPQCNFIGQWTHVDRREDDEKKLKIKRWNPKELEIRHNHTSLCSDIIWKIPQADRTAIKRGEEHMLETTPWEIIDCVLQDGNLRFDPEEIFNLSEDALAGQRMSGWGMPRAVTHFRQAWYVQVLHRFNEAIAMDYIMPMRVLSPAPQRTADPEAGDVVMNLGMGNISARLRSLLREHRRDPAQWVVSPIPLEYRIIGGEAKNLAPYELLDQGIAMLLNAIGVPVELYKGNLSTQAAPASLRLFESIWTGLVYGVNRFLQWAADSTARAMDWEQCEVKLRKVDLVDNLQNQAYMLQLAANRQISQTTALKTLGSDFKGEQRQILEDEEFIQDQQAEVQERLDQQAFMEQMAPNPMQQAMMSAQAGADPSGGMGGGMAGGMGGAGGMPAGPAGMAASGMMMGMPTMPNQKQSPQDVLAKADMQARQMLSMPEGQRQSMMTRLKHSDPTMHAQVKALIDDYNQRAATQGKQMVLQQQFGGS